MPFLSVELFGGASNRHATLTLLLLSVHVESKSKGALAQALGLLFQLLQLTLWKTTQLEDEATGGGAFPTIDMTTDDNRKMLLLRVGSHGGSTLRSLEETLWWQTQ